MKSDHRKIAVVVGVLCLGAFAAVAGAEETSMTVQQSPCCFENPRYSGTCQVTPGEGESCASILAYLNNPNSVGKNYCGNTKVRGGWTQVSCEEGAGTAAAADGQESAERE